MPYKKAKQRSLKRPILLIAVAILVLIIAALGGLMWHRHHDAASKTNVSQTGTSRPTNSVSYSAAPPADNNANETRKGSAPTATLNSSSPGTTPGSNTASFTVQLSATMNSNNGAPNVHVANLVSGTTSGSCVLTATQAGQSTLQLGSSSVSQDVNDYDCGPFNIPVSTFPTGGTWKLTLAVSNNGSQASGSANVTITK